MEQTGVRVEIILNMILLWGKGAENACIGTLLTFFSNILIDGMKSFWSHAQRKKRFKTFDNFNMDWKFVIMVFTLFCQLSVWAYLYSYNIPYYCLFTENGYCKILRYHLSYHVQDPIDIQFNSIQYTHTQQTHTHSSKVLIFHETYFKVLCACFFSL